MKLVFRLGNRGQSGAAPRTYAQDMGWKPTRRPGYILHEGHFRTVGLRWRGFARECSGSFDFYIFDPPIGFVRNSQWAGCFHLGDGRWYHITFVPGQQPKDLDSGIAAINKVLSRSLRSRVPQQLRRVLQTGRI